MKKNLLLIPLLLISLVACDDTGTTSGTTGGNVLSQGATLATQEKLLAKLRETAMISETISGSETKSQLSLTINKSTYSYTQQYSSGDYRSGSMGSVEFEQYRTVRKSSDDFFVKLLPYIKESNDGSMGGSFYNGSAIRKITNITITYKTSGTGEMPRIYAANELNAIKYQNLELSTEYITKTFNTKNTNFFRLSTSQVQLMVKSIEISYEGDSDYEGNNRFGSGDGLWRINPVQYEGTLVDGESQVRVPFETSYANNKYVVSSYKTYTYYSYEYVKANQTDEVIAAAAMVDPVDVATYYTVFGKFPANYCGASGVTTSDVNSLFGSNARQVSKYGKSAIDSHSPNGYMNQIPYLECDNPIYYEFDINVSGSYSTSSRGVGRVVIIDTGFDTTKAIDYGTSRVALFTDDHYGTFQEYLNNGHFGYRFNSEMNPTSFVWGAPKTITLN